MYSILLPSPRDSNGFARIMMQCVSGTFPLSTLFSLPGSSDQVYCTHFSLLLLSPEGIYLRHNILVCTHPILHDFHRTIYDFNCITKQLREGTLRPMHVYSTAIVFLISLNILVLAGPLPFFVPSSSFSSFSVSDYHL